MSETFTPRCSFGTTRRFRISPASYVDLTQTFSRRGFPSLPCLRRCVKYLTNVQSPKEKGRELQISSQFDAIFSTATRVQSSSVNRQAWFIFIGPDWRATISESYITHLLTYISMTKCLRRYRAVDTKSCGFQALTCRGLELLPDSPRGVCVPSAGVVFEWTAGGFCWEIKGASNEQTNETRPITSHSIN